MAVSVMWACGPAVVDYEPMAAYRSQGGTFPTAAAQLPNVAMPYHGCSNAARLAANIDCPLTRSVSLMRPLNAGSLLAGRCSWLQVPARIRACK